MRLINAEFLKLRKRRGLLWGSLFLIVGIPLIIFIILEILHLVNPAGHGPPGGFGAFGDWLEGIASGGAIAAVIIGGIAGTADVSTGVFRDLVATGRSRRQLFAARVPGMMMLLFPMITLGFLLILLINLGFAGSNSTPGAVDIVQGYGWVLLATGFEVVIAMGFASLIGSRAASIGVLLGWQLLASPILQQVRALGSARQALYTSSLGRLNPVPTLGGPNATTVTRSAAIAVMVLIVWVVVLLALGGWRTVTRDA
ncbi:MAG: hypothetical protein A2W01_02785 [Candidatus Solincola sediminis]|uniref:Uncharacterized protein n=1 Tax=Candidatus Solincola sediminis TaxID=1797199 RepID=A0A1F2WJS0_9ACTN|nr:MAG: hypothetical protein A2W01_02785 [Candidatus Solincola sediminis]OFW57115.1 MAG: hypothetical protein A2Y75_01975 [Candidatus Solincola sediminis]